MSGVVKFTNDTITAVRTARQALTLIKDFIDLQPRLDGADLQARLDELDDHLERMRVENDDDEGAKLARAFAQVHGINGLDSTANHLRSVS